MTPRRHSRAKKNLRLLLTGALPDPARGGQTVAVIAGGLLMQDRDNGRVTQDQLKLVTKRAPTDQELADCLFAWTVAKHVKSNAIVYAKDGITAGIGAGQMNRRDSARIAAIKAREAAETYGWPEPRTVGSAVASDAFFPFADGLLTAAEAGATAVIQPGGSMRDDEVIAAADEAGPRDALHRHAPLSALSDDKLVRLGRRRQPLDVGLAHPEQHPVLAPEAAGPDDIAEGREDQRDAEQQLRGVRHVQPHRNADREPRDDRHHQRPAPARHAMADGLARAAATWRSTRTPAPRTAPPPARSPATPRASRACASR